MPFLFVRFSCVSSLDWQSSLSAFASKSDSGATRVSWRFHSEWPILSGHAEGETALFLPSIEQHTDYANPMITHYSHESSEIVFEWKNVHDWPIMLLQINELNDEKVIQKGYGVTRLPINPGKHRRKVWMARPTYKTVNEKENNGWWTTLERYFLKEHPKYIDPTVLIKSQSRFMHETESVGVINVEFEIIMQHVQKIAHVQTDGKIHDDQYVQHHDDGDDEEEKLQSKMDMKEMTLKTVLLAQREPVTTDERTNTRQL